MDDIILPNIEMEVESAGGNKFMLLPRTKYYNRNEGETTYKIFISEDNPADTVTLEMKEKAEEKQNFDNFVSKILNFALSGPNKEKLLL